MKNTAKRLLAVLLCALMLLSAFAVIPAVAEETAAADDTPEPESPELTGIENLFSGQTITFDDWDPDGDETAQHYVWRKSGLFLTNSTGNLLDTKSTLVSEGDEDGGYRMQLNGGGTYINNAEPTSTTSASLNLDARADTKVDSSKALLDLLYSENGPLKYSLTMDFVIHSENFTGTADSNDASANAFTKHRGFSLIDFGGGWIVKATAPGAGKLTVETDETTGVPVKYSRTTFEEDENGVTYFKADENGDAYNVIKVDKVDEENAKVGYLYSLTYNGVTSNVPYVFDASTEMGWSSNNNYLGTLKDDEDQVAMSEGSNTYWVEGKAAACVPYWLIDGDKDNGEAFKYTADEPFTLRFDFEREPKSDNDTVKVTIYGVNDDNTVTLVGEKTYSTTTDVRNYGVRINDLSTTHTEIDNIKLTIPEDAEYTCGGDHASYVSKCEIMKIDNLPSYLDVTYDCGKEERVEHKLADEFPNVVAGKTFTVNNSFINGVSTNVLAPIGNVTMSFSLKTSGSFDPANSNYNNAVIVRLAGRNIINFGVVDNTGKLFTTVQHTDDESAPAITDDGSTELLTLEAGKTYNFKVVTVPPVARNGKYDVLVYVNNVLKATLNYTFASSVLKLNNYRVDGSSHISITNTRVYADNDFVIAAELNSRADYKKPDEDFELIKLGDSALLTLTTEGKVVTASGEVMYESLTPMRTYALFIKVLPAYEGFDIIYYKNNTYNDNAEVDRCYVQVTTTATNGLVFAAPAGLHINNIKAVTLSALAAYPTEASVTSLPTEDYYCLHRNTEASNALTTAATGSTRTFYTAPLLTTNSSGQSQGVNMLYYSYDCYYCGERVYVSMGDNLYNSENSDYQAYYYANGATNSTVTDSNKKVNAHFNGDGEVSLASNASGSYPTYMVYTNANVTKSGGVNFWLNFTYEIDAVDPNAIITKGSKGGGGSFFNIQANYSSLIRAYAVKPYEKGTTTKLSDTTALGNVEIYDPRATTENAAAGTAGVDYSSEFILLRSNTNSKALALVKAGDVLNFTFYIDPNTSGSATKIWLNGVLVNSTFTFGSNGAGDGYALRLYEGRHYVDGAIKNFAFVLDDRKETAHEHDLSYDGDVEIIVSDDQLYAVYDCYCGARITQHITDILKDEIENFYEGYGKVEYDANADYWIATDIGLKNDVESGALISLGDEVVLDASELTYTAPTTVTAAIHISDKNYVLYANNAKVKSGTLSTAPTSVTFGAEDAYDNYVSFKYNKIVELGLESFDGQVEFTDNPVGAVCYHEGSELKFVGNDYINTVAVDGYTFGETDNVKALKNIKARYICTECGEAVYATQGEALGVNNDKITGSTTLTIDENASSDTMIDQASRTVAIPFDEISYGNKLWLSFDFTYNTTTAGITRLMGRSNGGSVVSIKTPRIQQEFFKGNENQTDRFDYIQLIRGYAVIRPDVELDGEYTVNDYYDDRMGIWYTNASDKFNKPESDYMMVFMDGQTYKIDVCLEVAPDGVVKYTTYIDGKQFYSKSEGGFKAQLNPDRVDTLPENFEKHESKLDEEDYPVVDAETYTTVYSPALRFCDQTCGTYKVSNLAMVKMSAGTDNYEGNTTVFEITATKPDTAGAIASIGDVALLSVDADGNLLAADGKALTKKVDEGYENVVLGTEKTYISAVLYNGVIRYYTGTSADTLGYAYVGEALSAEVDLSGVDLTAADLTLGATASVIDIYGAVGNAETEYITYQKHMTTPNKIRVVAANDILYFGETGFRVRTERADGTVTEVVRSTDTVYSSILTEGSDTNTVTADRYGHRYFSLLELSDLANEDAGDSYTIYITPFNVVGEDGEAEYSAQSAVISVTVGSEAGCTQSVIATDAVPDVTAAQ